jgi:hypothetical protein
VVNEYVYPACFLTAVFLIAMGYSIPMVLLGVLIAVDTVKKMYGGR